MWALSTRTSVFPSGYACERSKASSQDSLCYLVQFLLLLPHQAVLLLQAFEPVCGVLVLLAKRH